MVNGHVLLSEGEKCSMFNVQRSRTVERRRKMFNGLTVFPPGGKGRSHMWDSPFPLVGHVVPTGGTPTYPQVYFQLIKHIKISSKSQETSPKQQKHHLTSPKTSPTHTFNYQYIKCDW